MIKIYDFDALVKNDYADIKKHLKSSGIIIYPTETSYGIGANAFDNSAVEKIFALKGRDTAKPLSLLVKDLNMLLNIAVVNRREEDIISKFWPGPLTILFKSKKVSEKYLFAAGSEFIGARVSPHPFALDLFNEIDFPITSTSANISGKDNISDFNELNEKFLKPLSLAKKDLGINILAVDCKELAGGSSTIIKIVKKNAEIIREGDNNIKKRLVCSIKNKEYS